MQPINKTLFSGIIWKMDMDVPGGWLAIETRHPQHKHALFSTINIADGRSGLFEHQTEDGWPSALEAIRNGVMLIHGFEHEGSPAHKGLTALDAKTGQVLWRNYAWSTDAVFDHYFLAFDRKMLPAKIFAASWRTGKPISSTQKLNDETAGFSIPQKLISWPAHLKMPFNETVGLIDYLAADSTEIISLHTPNANAFQQHLFIYQHKQLVYSDLLHTDIQKLQPDAFVMQRNRLVYIRNKNELVLIHI